jgi:hypothetical protein
MGLERIAEDTLVENDYHKADSGKRNALESRGMQAGVVSGTPILKDRAQKESR